MLKLGIDTGGTFTDAVLIDAAGGIAASTKSRTTHDDLSVSIDTVINRIAKDHAGQIGLVGLSTTLATNAMVEGRTGWAGLVMIGFKPDILTRSGLASVLGSDPHLLIDGGHSTAGAEERPLDRSALASGIETMAPKVEGFAVIGLFAVRNPAHELAAAKMILEATGKPTTCSHELTSKLDAPKRALTTLFNARLIGGITQLMEAVESSLHAHGVQAPLMVVRGDGALFSHRSARIRPIETILSGPAASCVGAAFLTGLKNAILSDIGGTTTDIGRIVNGRPKRHPQGAVVGGYRTMVDAVDVMTVGLGGDSLIRVEDGTIKIGPERALPLSQLVDRFPSLLGQLQAQASRTEARPYDGLFAVLQAPKDVTSAKNLSKSQLRLIELLRDEGPKSLETIIEHLRLGLSFKELAARGFVLRSGFTPTDAAHVLGKLDLGAANAAWVGAALLRRSMKRKPHACETDIVDFATILETQVIDRTAATIARFGLVQSGILSDEQHSDLIDRLISKGPTNDPLQVHFRMSEPLIAVGAPAALIYPEVAKKLQTELKLPPRFDVCNAIGAVVGLIERRMSCRIEVEEDRISVLMRDGPRPAMSLDQARDMARDEASALARTSIEADGAGDIEIRVSEDVSDYVDQTGTRRTLSIEIIADAVGRLPFAGIPVTASGTSV